MGDTTVDAILERAKDLKQALIEFVLEAEGELARALEVYSAEHLRSQQPDINQRNLWLDTFLTEGKVEDKTPLDLFLEDQVELSESDRALLSSWHHSFIGLFEIRQTLVDGFELMNWLTAKPYVVKPNNEATKQEMSRFQLGDILLARISPLTETEWMFSGPCIPMGKLGKPKLAVAIGNFKQDYKHALYSDAPELLEQSWQSVEQYHQDFLNFFGSDEVTMSGYELSKKIAEMQEKVTQQRLADAGIDDSKSLAEIAAEAGVDSAEMELVAEAAGADAKAVAKVMESTQAMKMVMPKVELPAELKKAEKVTVLAHPRWGQMFLPTYHRFESLLIADNLSSADNAEKLVRRYLESPEINAYVWYRLAEKYPRQLESLLQTVLQRLEFQLDQDLPGLLQEFDKPLEPDLPEVASVPVHLHDLFQEALAEVGKSKAKDKGKKKSTKGFQ
ncbi:hypothetical protein NDA01_27070 [Trichocoleus desertorum AS-A10]|uniref:hypothetical protein n=1 Tax=Trichocoleus desertorum TaxID=1481672 RepID=UPI00329D0439